MCNPHTHAAYGAHPAEPGRHAHPPGRLTREGPCQQLSECPCRRRACGDDYPVAEPVPHPRARMDSNHQPPGPEPGALSVELPAQTLEVSEAFHRVNILQNSAASSVTSRARWQVKLASLPSSWTLPDSNREPAACKAAALPIGAKSPCQITAPVVCGVKGVWRRLSSETRI